MATTNDVTNVTTGKPKKAGAIFRAAFGSTLPTDATTALDAAFVCLGYASEDGLVNSDTRDSNATHAWGGDAILYSESGREDTFQVTLVEATNTDALKAVYNDDNVSGDLTTGVTVKANSDEHDVASWVVDLLLTNGGVKRIVIPEGKLTDLGEITYNDTDPVGYQITISALPYADWDGDTHREFIINA